MSSNLSYCRLSYIIVSLGATSKRQNVRTKQDKLELGKSSSWPGASGDPG